MLSEQRYSRILELLSQNGIVKATDLMREFDVSSETVRRDLFLLEKKGHLKRVYGGAISSVAANIPFAVREGDMRPQKEEIARKAISLISDGDIIAIDSGTTGLVMAELLLQEEKRITVLTHSLVAFQTLVQSPYIKVYLTGGEYMAEESALCGIIAEANIKSFHVNKIFLCPAGVSLSHGYTDFSDQLANLSRTYLSIADKAIYLIDSSKFEHAAFMKINEVKEGDIIITDSELSSDIQRQYDQRKITVLK